MIRSKPWIDVAEILDGANKKSGGACISLDLDLVVQLNFITRHSSDAPAMTRCLEDGDFDVLSRNAGELKYAFIDHPNKQFLRFDRAPFKDTNFDDDVTLRAILWIDEVFFVQSYEPVKFLLGWIFKSLHDR